MVRTAKEIIEIVRRMSESDRQKVIDWAIKEKNKELAEEYAKYDDKKFQLAMKWIQENREGFDGQWVALDGDALLASGTDGKKVHAEAQSKGVNVPFMHRVSIKETEPFGGW